MTLLLSLVGTSGIHLSSDFRLTDISTRKSIEDVFGSKQLHFSFESFTAYVAFTGIAQVGPLTTVDWVSQTMLRLSQSITVEDAILELANAATAQFRNLPKQLRQLTMVVAVVLAQKPARLVVVTCNENPHGPALVEPLEQFAIYEFGTARPEVLLYGYTGAVSSADRKFLKKLNRNESPEEVRAALARVNARSAKNSNGTISAGCLVTSILPGGHAELQNFGGTPGLHLSVPDERNLLQQILPGKRPVFVQGREVRTSGTAISTSKPMNVTKGNALIVTLKSDKPLLFLTDSLGNTFTSASAAYGWSLTPEEEELDYENTHKDEQIGEPKTVELVSGKTAASIMTAAGTALGSITIDGMAKQLTLRKNKIAIEILNTINVKLDLAVEYRGPSHTMLGTISCIPTIDGIRPHEWSYSIEMTIKETGCTLSLRKMSVAFRSVNYAGGMKLLSSSEELALLAPRKRVELTVSKSTPIATANIEARFLLRDFDS
jgi:hypothetical protein